MTNYELAEKLNMKPSALSRLYTGRNGAKVGPRTAKRIAAYLKRSDWQSFYHMPGHELRALLMER